jgi:uncharacterized protein YbjT (DUF2867 family)
MNAPMAATKKLVIIGATGMVGGYALRYALEHPAVSRVTAIGRRNLGMSHPKLKESPDAVFSFLSGHGADPTEQSRMAFARYKGEAEKALLAAGFPGVYIFRPAYIYPVEPRKEPNFGYRLLRSIYPVFRVLFPNQVIPVDELAHAMVDVTIRGSTASNTNGDPFQGNHSCKLESLDREPA